MKPKYQGKLSASEPEDFEEGHVEYCEAPEGRRCSCQEIISEIRAEMSLDR